MIEYYNSPGSQLLTVIKIKNQRVAGEGDVGRFFRWSLFVFCIMFSGVSVSSSQGHAMSSSLGTQTVVLLHGIGKGPHSMSYLEKGLLAQGYQVLNLGYAGRKKKMNEIVQDLSRQLPSDPHQIFHFVGHSMGCLVIREWLVQDLNHKVGKVVLIAPPNQGSEVADFLQDNFLYRYWYGPAGQVLTTDYARKTPFPLLSYPFGVIAGDRSRNPLGRFILPKGNDGRVSIQSTRLSGMQGHVVLPYSHTVLLYSKATLQQTLCFLETGHFY